MSVAHFCCFLLKTLHLPLDSVQSTNKALFQAPETWDTVIFAKEEFHCPDVNVPFKNTL